MAALSTPVLAQTSKGQQPTAVATAWDEFARRFVTPDGRVVDTGNKGITHTEGVGVALLASQACDDRARFDKVWGFAQQLKRADGLFSWKWVQGSGVADRNNATDGDLYIAWALLRAGVRWADDGLLRAATSLVKSMREQLLVRPSQGVVLLPGKEGFIIRNTSGLERIVVNPAYWVFPALRELQAIDPTPAWAQLHKDALALLEQSRFGPAGLPADWVLLDDPIMPWQDRPARFGYEAIRVPLFLAWDKRHAHPALKACAQFMREPRFPAWVSLMNAEKANYTAPAGFESVARLARKSVFGVPLAANAVDADYFSSSLTLLAAIAAQDLGWA